MPDPVAVCLDGRGLGLREGTGVFTYAATLAQGLPGAGILLDTPPHARAWRTLRATWPFAAHARRLAEPPPGYQGAWLAGDVFRLAQVHFDIHGRLLGVASRQPPPLMHWTYPLPMTFKGVPNITTVHDLIPLTHPHLTGIDSARFARIIRQVARRASHIVTVSEASRQDIIGRLGVAPDRVTNTCQAVALPAGLADAPPSGRRGHFLFCGTIEARKNIGRLIAAYTASGATAPLILAGPDGLRAAEELAAGGAPVRPLESMPMENAGPGVWRAPWLERAAVLDLLRGARALLFPTLAEGFGLPVAEAMTLGVPVLTSNAGAAAEVAGAAAVLIDPLDIAGMAAAIAALDRDQALRHRLAAAGRVRARAFTQAACLPRLQAVYRQVGTRQQ